MRRYQILLFTCLLFQVVMSRVTNLQERGPSEEGSRGTIGNVIAEETKRPVEKKQPPLTRLPYVKSPPSKGAMALDSKRTNKTILIDPVDQIFTSGESDAILNMTLAIQRVEKIPFTPPPTMLAGSCPNDFIEFIVGGSNANPGQYPWQALVHSSLGFCGGVLIHSCYVLTAEHCTHGMEASQMTVTLGQHNRFVSSGNEQVQGVLKIFAHPTLDASILLLNNAAQQNTLVNWIELADFLPPTGTLATVTGWGWMTSSISSPATVLQQLQVPVADFGACAAQLNPYFPSNDPLSSAEFCAGDPAGPYANACHGDSGGPIAYQVSGTWKLIGIVNRGAPGCPSTADYAVYLSIPNVKAWILEHTTGNNLPGGAVCNCVNPVIKHDGSSIQATYDGANCYIQKAKEGCNTNTNPRPNRSFIWHNRYYETSSRAIECPLAGSWWDTCNCYYKSLNTLPAGYTPFIHSNKFYLSRGSHTTCHWGSLTSLAGNLVCYVASAPWGTNAFVYDNNWYTTARPTCNSPFSYDGANCYFGSIPPNGFIWQNKYYTAPGPGNSCPSGGWYDGANCYIMGAPWATQAFSWGGNWYHTPRRQCDDGAFDGANCLMMYPPSGATAFKWGGNLYFGW